MTEHVPLKWSAEIIAGQSPRSDEVSDLAGSGLPFLQGNAEFGQLHPKPSVQCDTAPKRAEFGDILLSVRAPVGALNVADRRYGIGRGLCAIRPKRDINRRFAWWALVASSPRLALFAAGSTYEAVTVDDIGALRIPVPEIGAQEAIAAYLDRETARIDALIAAKRQMMTLLEERQASWLHSVVMSSSKVSGTVPLKSVAQWVEGPGILAVHFRDEGVPLLRIRNLVGNTIELTGCGFVPESLASGRWNHLRVRAGELLVSGSARSGTPVVVPPEAAGAVPYTGLLRIWPVSNRLDRDYLRLFLSSPVFEDEIGRLKTGVGLQHWGPSHLSQIQIPLPSVDEQIGLAADFAAKEQRRGAMSRLLKSQMGLLEERREAAVTATVNGQLDIPEGA